MGYRTYFMLSPKRATEGLSNATMDNIYDILKHDDKYVWWPDQMEIMFEWGKYSEFDEDVKKSGIPLFKDPEVAKLFEENNMYIIGKKEVAMAIEAMRKSIEEMINEITEGYENIKEEKEMIQAAGRAIDRIKSYKRDIKNKVDLREGSKLMTRSWLYEDEIFNLVYLYKTIDWEYYDFIYAGW